jgi:hypothetical protein
MGFLEFPKISRLNRECTITEKIDGTNAHILIQKKCCGENAGCSECAGVPWLAEYDDLSSVVINGSVALASTYRIAAGSRTRYITPENDNFGFAKWVKEHALELMHLGEGRHYGEWWGPGIQRGYGLREKKFSLFNVGRWVRDWHDEKIAGETYAGHGVYRAPLGDKQEYAPACCDVVPVLYRGLFTTDAVRKALDVLHHDGSLASPGFLRPEGIVIFHSASQTLFKVTLEGDEQPKSLKK